jgi:hypothetical protein
MVQFGIFLMLIGLATAVGEGAASTGDAASTAQQVHLVVRLPLAYLQIKNRSPSDALKHRRRGEHNQLNWPWPRIWP